MHECSVYQLKTMFMYTVYIYIYMYCVYVYVIMSIYIHICIYVYIYMYICTYVHMYIQFYLLTFEFRRPSQNYMFARLLASTGMTEAELVHLCELAEPRPAWCRSTGRLTY